MAHAQTSTSASSRITLAWLIVGFVAGALAVLIFHQGAVALLNSLGIIPRGPYSMQPTRPLGVPQVWSITFWGGVWGIILALALARLHGARLVFAATVFGVIFPTLVAWFVVAPLRGQPINPTIIGPIVNGAWGLGTGLGLLLFRRR